MRIVKVGLAILGVASLLMLAGGTPEAFHSGGVAECAGCHSMHSPKPGGSFLLTGVDASSTCLNCHQVDTDTGPSRYHISTPSSKLGAGQAPLQRTPGGDFGWVKKSYNPTGYSEDGSTHGHNIIAADYGYVVQPPVVDPVTGKISGTTAPGGTYPNSQLGCVTCHDPHSSARRLSDGSFRTGITLGGAAQPIIGSGSYNNSPVPVAGEAVGVYRLLRGLNQVYQGVTFSGVAIAVAPETYNQRETTNQVRVAYGASGALNTWGNWCANCHTDMHSRDGYVHPVDESLGSDVANNYNAYLKTGDLTGVAATSYSSLVPFAEATGDFATLASHASNTNAYPNGPGSADKVMCLSCHRSHASGFMFGLRFDVEYEFMTKGGQYVGSNNPLVTGTRAANQHRGRTNEEWQAAYYDRPASNFATYQRVLCNKCHAKD